MNFKKSQLGNCAHFDGDVSDIDTDVTEHLDDLHNRYVIVPADKASNNVVFVCKTYYFECLQRELGLDDSISKSTYQRTAISKDEILANHRSVLSSFAIDTVGKDTDLPLLYWIPKLHKDPYKQRFIAGSSSCSTKPLSKLLTSILTTIKDGLQKYCDIVYSRSGINQMWILKNSKQLLNNLHSNSITSVNSIKTFLYFVHYHSP